MLHLLIAMRELLRKIDRKINWAKDGDFTKYLSADAAPADALQDLSTTENRLSIWRIEEDRTNLDRVLAAIVSGRDNLQKCDFIIFDSRHIEENGLEIEANPGGTLDSDANSKWHLNLTHLSATGLGRLANAMFAYGERHRRFERELIPLLRQSISSGYIQEAALKPNVAAKVSN